MAKVEEPKKTVPKRVPLGVGTIQDHENRITTLEDAIAALGEK